MKKVLLGMSGGVDSSVAAYLLQEQGYEVIGATMRLWKDKTQDVEDIAIDAKKVADTLGIKHIVIDFEDTFKGDIVDYFMDSYFEGKTPNPCVLCNKKIKFGMLYDKAKELGCEYIATGHYANVEEGQDGKLRIKKSDFDEKDQTYVLYNLNQEKLRHTLFPIGKYNKEQIRSIAKKIGLEVYNKPESQDICFIPDNDYIKFIKTYSDKKVSAGKFMDKKGNVLGDHKGIINYTIGQRKGLGIAFGKPMYVIDINDKNNSVVLGSNEDLFNDEVKAKGVNFVEFDKDEVSYPLEVEAKIRYSAKPAKAKVYRDGEDSFNIKFETPQRAATKGQSIVFYDGKYLVGGGIIV